MRLGFIPSSPASSRRRCVPFIQEATLLWSIRSDELVYDARVGGGGQGKGHEPLAACLLSAIVVGWSEVDLLYSGKMIDVVGEVIGR